MSDTSEAAPAADIFDLSDLETGDEATLAIKDSAGRVTTWVWTFYGPGHPKTIALSNRVSKKYFQEARDKEQAQVNGKKWKAEEHSLDELRKENVGNIIERTKGFTPVKLNGIIIEFSAASARELLLDPRKGSLYAQISEFLREDENFIRPSAKS